MYISAPESRNGGPRLEAAWSFEIHESRGEPSDFAKHSAISDTKLHNRVWEVSPDAVCFVETHVYRQANALFVSALKATERSDILDRAFEGYWNLVVAAPDIRGSAAKSHYVLHSILLAKGIELPPAQKGLAPDLEAMSRTRDAWVVHARKVFGTT